LENNFIYVNIFEKFLPFLLQFFIEEEKRKKMKISSTFNFKKIEIFGKFNLISLEFLNSFFEILKFLWKIDTNFYTNFQKEKIFSIFFTLKKFYFFENFLNFVKKYDINNFLHFYFKNIFANFLEFCGNFSSSGKEKNFVEIFSFFFEEIKILDFIIDSALLDKIKFENLKVEINSGFFSNLLELGEMINNSGKKFEGIKEYLDKGKKNFNFFLPNFFHFFLWNFLFIR